MFGFIKSLLSTVAPPPPGPIVTVFIISADGTPPRIEHLATLNVEEDGREDRFLHMRAYGYQILVGSAEK